MNIPAQAELFDTLPERERLAIERLQLFAPLAGQYILATSGGKDSAVLERVAQKAGVDAVLVYNSTTVDPPELRRAMRKRGDVLIRRPKLTMFELVRKKGLPSASIRWCCRALKEHTYPGRWVLTGIRWDESIARAKRLMVEQANRCKSQTFLHPIIDWSLSDVLRYIEQEGIKVPAAALYEEGMARVGCVCCPMGTKGYLEAERWPNIARSIRRAFRLYCETHPDRIYDEAGMWEHWLHGKLGREPQPGVPIERQWSPQEWLPGMDPLDEPYACPLMADERSGVEG